LPFFKAYKAHTWERLKIGSGQKILDVACGIEFDVIKMAIRFPSADFWGLDSSVGFLEIAKSRAGNLTNVKFLQGNGDRHPLPLPENEFDGVRIDRSLQHMKDPHSAIKEMVRVTRPEGHLVAAEPDWETFVLYNGDLDIGAKLAKQFKGSIRNPYVGRELGMIFTKCGVVNPQCNIHADRVETAFARHFSVTPHAQGRVSRISAGKLGCRDARGVQTGPVARFWDHPTRFDAALTPEPPPSGLQRRRC
jgi:SAM-dependent methyltransferase